MAAAGFRIRRIRTAISIGDRLKRARTRRKITVAEVEEATKIRARFILALESDSWEQIPSEVYGRGYLERYLDFLQLPTEEIRRQYDKERQMYARHCQDAQIELAPKSRIKLPRFLLTPRFFGLFMLIVALGAFASLVGSQIIKFSSAPFLELASPAQAQGPSTELIVTTDSVTISGRTAVGAKLTVNDEAVEVTGDGRFSTQVLIQKGVNVVEIKAQNGKGKETVETLSIVKN